MLNSFIDLQFSLNARLRRKLQYVLSAMPADCP
jgi:hypothetical protein